MKVSSLFHKHSKEDCADPALVSSHHSESVGVETTTNGSATEDWIADLEPTMSPPMMFPYHISSGYSVAQGSSNASSISKVKPSRFSTTGSSRRQHTTSDGDGTSQYTASTASISDQDHNSGSFQESLQSSITRKSDLVLSSSITDSTVLDLEMQGNGLRNVMLPTYHERRSTSSKNALSLAQLDFKSVGLVGREEAVAKLQASLERVMKSAKPDVAPTITRQPNVKEEGGDGSPECPSPQRGGGGAGADRRNRRRRSSRTTLGNWIPNVLEELQEVSHSEDKDTSTSGVTLPGADLPASSSAVPLYDSSSSNRELVLIRGLSGTGKSRLVQSIKAGVMARGGLYVTGKFGFSSSPVPYSAVAAACQNIIGEILQLRNVSSGGGGAKEEEAQEKFQTIQIELQTEFGAELQYLTHVLPELWELLDHNDDTNATAMIDQRRRQPGTLSSSQRASGRRLMLDGSGSTVVVEDDTNQGSLDAQNQQILYAFRLFFRLICKHFSPLTIVLDDLQWADSASLELLKHLISDRDNLQPLMIVGCYRSDEVEQTQTKIDEEEGGCHHVSFQQTLMDLKSTSHRDGFRIEEIELTDLSLPGMNQFLRTLLRIEEENHNNCVKASGLAELVFNRTKGNPFYTIVFLSMLRKENLLDFNLANLEWRWDLEHIASLTFSTSNVVDLLTSKMERMPQPVQTLLQLAACLGSSFEKQVLQKVWNRHSAVATDNNNDKLPTEDQQDLFEELLHSAVSENFVEPVASSGGSCSYTWVHDKVLEAALALINEEELAEFQFGVGLILYEDTKEEDDKVLDGLLFVVVNLLNQYPQGIVDPTIRLEIIQLNAKAAEKATTGSAFVSAARYAAVGIRLLPDDRWTSLPTLTLNLYSIGAEAEGIRGQIDEAKVYFDEVVNNSQNEVDKLRVYYLYMDTLTNLNRAAEATDICLRVLAKFDCKFPFKPGGQAWAAIKDILKLSKEKYIPTQDEMDQLPLITDPSKAEVMKLLSMLTTQCYYTKNKLLFVLVFYKMFVLTMEYGISLYSPMAFCGYGMIFNGVIGDFQGSAQLGKYAFQMLERLKTRVTISRTYQGTYTFLMSWTKPILSFLKPYREGYKVGMQHGDTESATWCLHFYINALFVTGRSLDDLAAECFACIPQMEELKREVAHESTQILLQFALNLMGRSSDVFVLTGDIIDEDQWLKKAKATKNETNVNAVYLYKTLLYAYMGEHRMGAKLALKRGDKFVQDTPGFFMCMPETFCRAVSLSVMARKKKKRKYRKAAAAAKTVVETWLEKGNPNVVHYKALLDAEHFALKGKREEARKCYGQALSLATRGGFLHDAAMANECYADFLLTDCGDRDEARHYLKKASRCFSEWGAHAKVEQLKLAFHDLLHPGGEGRVITGGASQEITRSDVPSSLQGTSGFISLDSNANQQ